MQVMQVINYIIKALTENISSINRDDLNIEIGLDKDKRVLTIKDHGIGWIKMN